MLTSKDVPAEVLARADCVIVLPSVTTKAVAMADESPERPRIVRFGTFEADLGARELRKGGVRIKLQGQPFEVLAMLLERPGEVVPREELRQRLWSTDTFVDFDAGVNTAINRLREALGDSAENARFIETVPRRGYRFIAHVEAEGSRLRLSNGAASKPASSEVKQTAVSTPARIPGKRLMVLALGLAALVVLLAALSLTGVRERLSSVQARRALSLWQFFPWRTFQAIPVRIFSPTE